MSTVVRVVLPAHLKTLAGVSGEVRVEVDGCVSACAVLDALETAYPVLRGTIREHGSLERRAFVRFFAGEDDISHDPVDAALPESVATGREPFCVIGAMAGG